MGRGSTPSGSVDPSCLPSPPSSTWGEEVLRLDRWIHPVFPLHLPADVDHQAGVRRVRPIHCPQEVLLNFLTKTPLQIILFYPVICNQRMYSSYGQTLDKNTFQKLY